MSVEQEAVKVKSEAFTVSTTSPQDLPRNFVTYKSSDTPDLPVRWRNCPRSKRGAAVACCGLDQRSGYARTHASLGRTYVSTSDFNCRPRTATTEHGVTQCSGMNHGHLGMSMDEREGSDRQSAATASDPAVCRPTMAKHHHQPPPGTGAALIAHSYQSATTTATLSCLE